VTDLAALVLAAGAGKRLQPLTRLKPKPLCPIGDTTLLDLALDRVGEVVPPTATAVNAHHLAQQIAEHVGAGMHLSIEEPVALGTAGAVGAIAAWRGDRDLLIANGDVYLDPPVDVASFVAGWAGDQPRLLVVADDDRPDFHGGWRFAGLSLLPADLAATLPAEPLGLYEAVWRDRPLDLVPTDSGFIDCGDPASYLAANLAFSGGESVIGPGAMVDGELDRCVVWPGAVVHRGERLVEAIRARDVDGSDLTVPAHLRSSR
jgi:molybdopterin-guanine dinucleotide biosynthesis protein A